MDGSWTARAGGGSDRQAAACHSLRRRATLILPQRAAGPLAMLPTAHPHHMRLRTQRPTHLQQPTPTNSTPHCLPCLFSFTTMHAPLTLYSSTCSKKMMGLSLRMALFSSALALATVETATSCTPAEGKHGAWGGQGK